MVRFKANGRQKSRMRTVDCEGIRGVTRRAPLTGRRGKKREDAGGGAAEHAGDNHADYEASFVANLHSCGVLSTWIAGTGSPVGNLSIKLSFV